MMNFWACPRKMRGRAVRYSPALSGGCRYHPSRELQLQIKTQILDAENPTLTYIHQKKINYGYVKLKIKLTFV
jgi:hypothetical protein